MIINVRGTSGSGKTYAVRQLMKYLEQFGSQSLVYDDNGKVVAHCCHYKMQPVYVLGNYSRATCGGCDTIRTQNMVCSLVRHFSQFGHVVFEGLLVSGMYTRYAALDNELASYGEHCVWLYLTTPLDLCLDRISKRRLAAGNTKKLNPDNTIAKAASVERSYAKMLDAGMDARPLHHDSDVVSQIVAVLDEDDSMAFSNSYKEEFFRKRKDV